MEKPFTKEARFDFDLLAKHTQLAQRIMDDIIDLETEKIDAILQKIESDPESEDVKETGEHYGKRYAKRHFKADEQVSVLLQKAI